MRPPERRDHRRLLLAPAAALACLWAVAGPAPAPLTRAQEQPGGPSLQPGFQVAPLGIELTGRVGQTLPFELELIAPEKAARVALKVVGLSQDETGAISPDPRTAPSGLVATLDPQGPLTVTPDAPLKVRGQVRIGATGGGYRLMGIHLTPAERPGPAATGRSGVEIQIAYMTRISVRVEGVPEPRARELRVARGGLVDREGQALAQVVVENPTDQAFELLADAQLFRREPRVRVGPSFPLALPVNAGRAGPERTAARILGGARVRCEALVPQVLVPGNYVLSVRLSSGKERVQCELPVEVGPQDFPAQAVLLGRTVGAVLVTPPRIELSSVPGGSRIVPLRLDNLGQEPVTVRLEARSLPEAPVDWVRVAPAQVELGPGQSRRVAVTLRADRAGAAHRYGVVCLELETGTTGAASIGAELPLAAMGREGGAPRLEAGPLAPLAAGQGFTWTIRNTGSAHAPLHASLRIADPSTSKLLEAVSGGYGAWLQPGAEARLELRPRRPLPPGKYAVTGALERPGDVPLSAALEHEVRGP